MTLSNGRSGVRSRYSKLMRFVVVVVCLGGLVAMLAAGASRGGEPTLTNRRWGTQEGSVGGKEEARQRSLQPQEQVPQGQQAEGQQAAIKSDVRIVLVDVVVTGAKGQTASGLKKEDFQVSEDGAAQTVSFFEEHTGGKVTPVALPAMPPGEYTNYPTVKTTDSVNVLLLDSLNTQAINQVDVRPEMEKYVEAATASPNGARLAIFTLGQQLRMIQGFTADASKSLE